MDILLLNGARAAGLLDAMEREALLRTAVVRLVEAARMWRDELPRIVTPESCRTQGGTEMLKALRDIDRIMEVRK